MMNLQNNLFFLLLLVFQVSVPAQSEWNKKYSENFILIYKNEHAFLAGHILNSAERSLDLLSTVFEYKPSERIIINTYDINDYGFASATTVPENFIRLEIEPFEPGYENIPYNDRFQWILSHELVHIVLNDQATNFENISRTLFSKVSPEQIQPMTILYSLFSNYSRYTSRWHQESPAVFMETWLSGGYGRILGSFDEMYFRSLVYEKMNFPSDVKLDAVTSHNSFLLETLFYIYGGRFAAYLSVKFGSEKLVEWFKVNKSDFYASIQRRFKDVFNADFYKEWNNFTIYEKEFQYQNIRRITSNPVTPTKHLINEPLGWTTSPFITADGNILFGTHRPHHLASIVILEIRTGKLKEITTLPSPSMYQVTSLAYDSSRGFLFYTTNNNQLYRDVWALDIRTGKKKEIFPDLRIGQISVSPGGNIWGIQNAGGKTTLVVSKFPYSELRSVHYENIPDEILQVSADPSGNKLAIVVHRSSGIQQMISADLNELLSSGKFVYDIISETGIPENPSWSPDGDYLFWNAFVNGVSNIYRYNIYTKKTEILSNTIRGLFRPVMQSKDSLFVFEFTSKGFIPSLIKNKPVEKVNAIKYMGQDVIENNPGLTSLSIPARIDSIPAVKYIESSKYNGLAELKIQAFIPVITGFQKQKVLGFFTRLSDPLLNHDLSAEFGYSPFSENPAGPKFHLRLKYEYMKKLELGIDYNAPDFYDLFNSRKRGTIGTKIRAGYSHYWLYDNPHKIKQTTEIALYTDFQYINDNLVRVSEPDFGVAQNIWNSKNLRRSIGSSDYESGDDLTATIMAFGSDPGDPQFAGEIHLEWDKFFTYIIPHNVFHYKFAGGYHYKNERLLQAMYYFGGFGNREVENTDVKQYRSVFRFPGIPIYSLSAERFIKILLENNFPPIRFSNISLGQHYLSHIDFSIYSQGLAVKSFENSNWIDAGAQLNLIFKHWFNLESTLSAGIAKAWSVNQSYWEWFISYKLLRN
jgi:hypothetical protein